MKKGWKFKAVDLYLRLVAPRKVRLQSAQQLMDETNFSHIVIYSTTALGDFMFNTPAIHAVRQRFPDATITLVVHQKLYELVVDGSEWQHVLCWNSKVNSVPRLVKDIRNIAEPDLAIILHSHDPYDYLSAVLSGARYVLRDNHQDGIEAMNRWLSGYVIGFHGHLIQRRLELVAMLGADINDIAMRIPFPLAPAIKHEHRIVLGFQMGASTPERCWPVEYFARLTERVCASDERIDIVLIGGGEREIAQGKAFFNTLDNQYHSRVLNNIGATTLKELVATIQGMDMLLTGDTGPLHLAVALRVPTVSLFVTATPALTGPYQDPELHDIIYGIQNNLNIQTDNLMRLISLQQVEAKVRERIEKIDVTKYAVKKENTR
ncbi:glycosyltransferase family 9 protein [Dickeya sp. CFBP 2040]|uniref:glycosyltransferase family 9 protein n=1 Tax=Dickeya sp. CFBP 2040 TaxID=2718531 RepID=UPI0014459F2D|nr:glycosyltransferase family 9 protein [Dickeya sp. CFBP 2040]NKI73869.1 glycosyltransferase family 9 protein [Dickeya sp. CFBP 2040]